jgi:hypothetical protein
MPGIIYGAGDDPADWYDDGEADYGPPDDLPPPPGESPDDNPPGPTPRKLTVGTIQIAAMLLAQGNYRSVVARRIGISPSTWARWVNLSKKYPRSLYRLFADAVAGAEASFETIAVEAIRQAGTVDVAHMEWLLERKFPERWGRFRGETGELKRHIREQAAEIAELKATLAELESLHGVMDAAGAGNLAAPE